MSHFTETPIAHNLVFKTEMDYYMHIMFHTNRKAKSIMFLTRLFNKICLFQERKGNMRFITYGLSAINYVHVDKCLCLITNYYKPNNVAILDDMYILVNLLLDPISDTASCNKLHQRN